MQIIGYEKAWLAFLAGGAATAAQVLALWVMSLTGAIPAPGAEAIAAGVTGIVASAFAAAGAFFGTNTTPSHPDGA